jgi:hypothetical protein
MIPRTANDALRRVVLLVAILNLAYFGVEFAVALTIGSVLCSPTASIFWKMPRSIF